MIMSFKAIAESPTAMSGKAMVDGPQQFRDDSNDDDDNNNNYDDDDNDNDSDEFSTLVMMSSTKTYSNNITDSGKYLFV